MLETQLAGIYHRAETYEAMYLGRGKDYSSEAAAVIEVILERNPQAGSMLDVACGVGGHLTYFQKTFAHVEGLDLSKDMLRVAKNRLPDVPLHHADMTRFALTDRFDVVTCLFSSIGYLTSGADLDAALRCFADHVRPGGLVLVEPWWFPEKFLSGRVVSDLATVGGQTIARVSHAVRDADRSHMQVHYLVADEDTGVRHFTDTHVMSLFTRARYEAAFTAAGLAVDYVSGPRGPGLFVGTRPAQP
jgi:SAM-dependent methyltransferase